jgi:uncharacterized protein with PIN domain
MSIMPDPSGDRPAFIVDRMLGTLCRYLRFLGYDTLSANSLREGNKREDTLLLKTAERTGRILLTRDRELAARGGPRAILIAGNSVLEELRELADLGLVSPELRLDRCSLCNEQLRPAHDHEVAMAPYAPKDQRGLKFSWCKRCRKLYWMGSHGRSLEKRIKDGL